MPNDPLVVELLTPSAPVVVELFPLLICPTAQFWEYPLSYFGAVGDGVTDDRAAIQAAIDSGYPIIAKPGTYLVDGQLTLRSNLHFRGSGKRRSVFKLKAGANTTMFYGADLTDLDFGGFTIDADKRTGNTMLGLPVRALEIDAVAADCKDLYLHDLLIANIPDHGVFLSSGTGFRNGLYSAVERCSFINVGSQAHSDAGGVGGTGFVGGYGSNRFFACDAIDCFLNGFKAAGVYKGCTVTAVAQGNGGFETQGVAGAIPANLTYDDCHVVGTGGAWRIVGTDNIVRIVNCSAREIGFSAITAFNTIAELHVDQFTAVNCGKNGGARPSGGGFDAVSLIDISSAEPAHAFISNIRGVDNQGTPTMEYGVWVGDGWSEVHIGGENEFVGMKNGAFNFAPTIVNEPLSSISGNTKGWSLQNKNFTPATVTGTTALTTLMPIHTMIRKEFPWGAIVEIFSTGTVAGTGGIKTIYASLQGINVSAVTFAAGESGAWMVHSTIVRQSATGVQISTKGGRDTAATTEKYNSYSYPSGDDLTYCLKVILANAADSITQSTRIVRAR